MKRRFETSSQRSGRTARPVRRRRPVQRRPRPGGQPAPEQSRAHGMQRAADVFSAGAEPRLKDEVAEEELAEFGSQILRRLSQPGQNPERLVAEFLPGFARLKDEHRAAVEDLREQRRFTKKLVRACEPFLSHASIPESDKSGLLDAGALSVEKMMQLKMRVANLAQRIDYLEREIPLHLHGRGQSSGYPESVCAELSALAGAALRAY